MDEPKRISGELAGVFQQTQTPRARTQGIPQDPNPPPPEPAAKRIDERSPHPHRGQNLNTTV